MLSASAAVALLATGVMAFESDVNGRILTENTDGTEVNATYMTGVPAVNDLNLSTSQRGDALIYPFYRMTDGWESEMVVRNTSPHATIAKVVLYGSGASEELIDFNIYLSPYDVFRFTVKESATTADTYVVTTTDGSIPTGVTGPEKGTANDDADFNAHNSDEEFEIATFRTEKAIAGKKGYAIIYGMTQYNDNDTLETAEDDLNYHKEHKALWADYRRLLDDCRPGWRGAYTSNGSVAGMIEGMMTIDVQAPNVAEGCGSEDQNGAISDTDSNSTLADYNLSRFGDVADDTLIGTVRVSQGTDGAPRDLLLPATALQNFTDGNMLLWTAGEYAAIQDRRISADNPAIYDEAGIVADAATFLTSAAYYTYDSDSIANKMVVTQPLKRILVQLGNDNGYWTKVDDTQWGGFFGRYSLFDEDESVDSETITITKGNITSPFNSDPAAAQTTHNDEVAELIDLEDAAENEYFKTTDGFAYVNFTGEDDNSTIPAIVTQMVGTKVNGVSQTNWIYAPTIK